MFSDRCSSDNFRLRNRNGNPSCGNTFNAHLRIFGLYLPWFDRRHTSDTQALAKEQILFDGIYTGYLASAKQIEYVQDVIKTCIKRNAPVIVDPAMADNGKLYPAFDIDFVSAMKNLCSQADVILPNITEACFLTGKEYKSVYNEAYIDTLLSELAALGAKQSSWPASVTTIPQRALSSLKTATSNITNIKNYQEVVTERATFSHPHLQARIWTANRSTIPLKSPPTSPSNV